jgi:predicted TIM-barrel fold metal-dependent hydrolase
MIIDCHTHINNYHNEKVDSLNECLENLQKEMKRNRVDCAVILTSYKVTPGRPSTRDVVRATRDLKHLTVVAGISFLNYSPDDIAEVREYLQEKSVRGLKLYPGYEPFFPNDPRMRPVFELAAEQNIPVMVHTGDTFSAKGKLKYSHPLNIDEVAVDFPDVNIVICHLGNPWFRDTMEVVYKNANVHTDISGLVLGDFTDRFEAYMKKQFQEMMLYGLEPDKVLYGTDWPISEMDSYLDFMDELTITAKDKQKILYDNAAAMFGFAKGDSFIEPRTLSGLFR